MFSVSVGGGVVSLLGGSTLYECMFSVSGGGGVVSLLGGQLSMNAYSL